MIRAHAFGVGHGRLSADTVLVDQDGKVMILGFWTSPIMDNVVPLDTRSLIDILTKMVLGSDERVDNLQLAQKA